MTRAITVLLLFPLLLLSAAPAPAAGNATKGADAKLGKLVNEAIDRGAKWLRKQQRPDGSFPTLYGRAYPMGPTALALLALLHSGENPESEVTGRGFAFVMGEYQKATPQGLQTYSVSVTIMALAEYGRALGAKKGKFHLPDAELRWLKDMTRWLVAAQTPQGTWHYPYGGAYDHSNTQYALLALKEARRVGVRVEPKVFARALEHFVRSQQKNGPKVPRFEEHGGDGVYSRNRKRVPGADRARGWGYTAKMPPTGSMTAAGAAAVAISVGELVGPEWKHLRGKGETSRRDGIAWLGKHFSVKVNPASGAAWHYYYLYGLERSGVLAGVVYMGKHRWYAEGAKYLVDAQSPDGAWRTAMGRMPGPRGGKGAMDIVDPSFALLFLVRATARSFGAVTERNLLNLTEAHKLSDRDLLNVFGVAFKELGTLSDEARADRASDFAFFGPRVLPLLIQKLADADDKHRARAFLVLRRITGKTFDYDPAGPATERAAAIDRFTEWYLLNRKKLALDRPAKVIR